MYLQRDDLGTLSGGDHGVLALTAPSHWPEWCVGGQPLASDALNVHLGVQQGAHQCGLPDGKTKLLWRHPSHIRHSSTQLDTVRRAWKGYIAKLIIQSSLSVYHPRSIAPRVV